MSLGDSLGDIFKAAALEAISVTGDVIRARNIPPPVIFQPPIGQPIQVGLGPVTAPPGFAAIGPGGGGGGPVVPSNGGTVTRELQNLEAAANGGGALVSGRRAPGGIGLGVAEGAFHTTPTGRRMPNRITLLADAASGQLMFAVNAGTPKTWSKISFKRARPRHHHHRARHHHHRKR